MLVNYKALDWWSAIHFAIAFTVAVYLPLNIAQFTLINILWEISEIYVKRYIKIPFFKRVESPVNTTVDIMVTEIGWLIGHFVTYGTWY